MRNMFVLAATIMLTSSAAFSAGGNMGGGTGIETNPFLIEDMADFDTFADPDNSETYLAEGVYTKLACDPNLAAETYTESVIEGFFGIFDGDGHTISNITFNITVFGQYGIGLFGFISGDTAEVKNLGLLNCNFTDTTQRRTFGGLCGSNIWGTITNCYVTGSINGGAILGGLCGVNRGNITDSYATCSITGGFMLGGICGSNDGTITNCYASGSVTGTDFIGGLCGKNYGAIDNSHATCSVTGNSNVGGLCGINSNGLFGGTITNCYATGSINGGNRAGGLCGVNEKKINNCYASGSVEGGFEIGGLCGLNNWNSTITNCYSTGSVKGDNYFGGLCGVNGSGMITNCYATGLVSGDNATGGGFCGIIDGPIANCFWNTDTSGISDPEGGLTGTDTDGVIGMTTGEMQTKSNFTNAWWDFAGQISDGIYEVWEMPAGGGYPVLNANGYIPAVLSGDGTAGNPYLISNSLELAAISYYEVNAYYKLQADIDLSGIGWSGSVIPSFNGDFDGDGYVIHNLNIHGNHNIGLFGMINNGNVENLGIENGNIVGGNNSGNLGILCGSNSNGTITNCYASGSVVSGTNSISLGSLCGVSYNGTITGCYSTGSVNGGNNSISLGGLCGTNHFRVANCYSTSSVNGGVNSSNLGGLCGENGYKITNCYATGSVIGGVDSDNLGGLCGLQNGYNAEIANCFWDTVTSDVSIGCNLSPTNPGTITNVVGKNTDDMQSKYTYTTWDFVGDSGDGTDDVWDICEGTNYPRLVWQIPAGDYLCPYGVSFEDLGFLAMHWLDTTNEADLTGDGKVDARDFAVLAQNWRLGTE